MLWETRKAFGVVFSKKHYHPWEKKPWKHRLTMFYITMNNIFFQKSTQENQSRNKKNSHSQCWGEDVLTLQELLNIELFCHWKLKKIKTKNWDTVLVLLESPQGVGFYWGNFFVIFRDKTQERLNFDLFQLEISKIEWYSNCRLRLSFFNFKILSIDYNLCWTTPAMVVKDSSE